MGSRADINGPTKVTRPRSTRWRDDSETHNPSIIIIILRSSIQAYYHSARYFCLTHGPGAYGAAEPPGSITRTRVLARGRSRSSPQRCMAHRAISEASYRFTDVGRLAAHRRADRSNTWGPRGWPTVSGNRAPPAASS